MLSIACAKEQERFTTVVFNVSGVESGPLTKGLSEGVAAALAATAPSPVATLTAVSKTNPLRKYTITPGEALTMAIDSYTVTASGTGTNLGAITGGNLYSTPSWAVSEDVDVSSGSDTYSVSAYYTCVAFVIDKTTTERLSFANGANSVNPSGFGGTDEVSIIYASGTWTYSKPLYVHSYPIDTVNYEETVYKVSNQGDYEGMQRVRSGYWYNLTPGAVAVTSGTIGINFPTWGAGQ